MKKPSLLVIFLTVFIDLIGFGIVMPLLPLYSKQFGASGIQVGMIIASFSLMQFLVAPLWGRLSDRIGRRPVLLMSNAGSVLSYAMFAFASGIEGQRGLWLLLASRVFAGIAGANISVASAYIADVSTKENRSKSMGLIGMAFGLGFIFGPTIGGLSAKHLGLTGPGWVATGICAFNFILTLFILKESRQPSSETAVRRPKFAQIGHTLRQPVVGFLVITYFLSTFCFAAFEATFGLVIADNFRYDTDKITYLFTYCGLISAFIQGGMIGRLVKKFGERKLIAWSLVIIGLGMVSLPLVKSAPGLLIGLAVFAGASGVNRPPTFGLISNMTEANEQGATLGVAQSAGSLARILAPIFAASLYDVRGPLPYLICAVIAVLTGIVALRKLCGPQTHTAVP
ncbi:MAG TPA: MFS transporter [Methylomirabilota bacterium]|nr:MFS transporter [Methylomirabilota bacterium]